MSNIGTTGRIPLWLVGTVVGLLAIGLLGSAIRSSESTFCVQEEGSVA